MKGFKTLPLLLLFVFPLSIQVLSQASNQEESNLADKDRFSKLKPRVIERLEESLQQQGQAKPVFRQILSEASAQLKAYYSQFIQKKRIAYERNQQSPPRHKLDQHSLRLLEQEKRKKFAKPYFVEEVPFLFRLHVITAKSHAALGEPQKAVAAFAMAFRYAKVEPLTLEEQRWQKKIQRLDFLQLSQRKLDEFRQELASQTDIAFTDNERETSYATMSRGFADTVRVSQENNPQYKADAKDFRDEWQRYKQLKKAYRKAARQVDVAKAQNARNFNRNNVDINSIRQQRDGLKSQWEQSKETLEQIRKGSYTNYIIRRRAFHSDVAYQMALQIRRLELENKTLLERKKRPVYLRSIGIEELKEKKGVSVDYSGFRALLELAHKINPFHIDYIRLLSDENRHVHNLKQATFYTHLYLQHFYAQTSSLQREEGNQSENTKNTKSIDAQPYILRLGDLYAHRANFIQAARSYELFLNQSKKLIKEDLGAQATSTASRTRMRVVRYLADLHYKKTGRLERAAQLYEEYLQVSDDLITRQSDVKKRNDLRLWRCKAFSALGNIARRQQDSQGEQDYLQKAKQEYLNIEKDKLEVQTQIVSLENRLLELKRKLLKREDSSLQKQYYQLKLRELQPKQEEAKYLKSRILQLNLGYTLERLAFLAWSKRQWSKAEEYYQEVLEKGSGEQIRRARKNLKSLSLTREDGKMRRPLL